MSEGSNSSVLSYVITLGAVAIGWVLGETSGWFKKRYSVRNLKKSLFLEIEDCHSWLLRNQITLEHLIQLAVLKEVGEFGPVEVPTYIYDNHIPQILPHLSRSERISYISIYNLIRSSHKDSIKLRELGQKVNSADFEIKEFSSILEAVFYNTSLAIFQIQYHLDNTSTLNVDKFSAKFTKELEHKITNRVHELCIEAKRIGLAEVHQKYIEN